jgi:hypothetical protein
VAAHDPVPDRELAVLNLQPVFAEAAAGGQELLAGGVESVDLAPAGGQDHHLLGRVVVGLLPGDPPVLQQREGGGGFGVGGHHPVMGLVGGHRLVDHPGADEVEGFAFPGLLLATVLGQLRGTKAVAEGAEAAAGIDRRQLPVIADQHHLGLGLVGVPDQPTQFAAADHAGLIDDQHGARVQLVVAAVQVAQQPIAGGHVLEPLTLQAHGGDPRRGRCEQPVAVQLPGVAGDAEGEGLAGPGSPHD